MKYQKNNKVKKELKPPVSIKQKDHMVISNRYGLIEEDEQALAAQSESPQFKSEFIARTTPPGSFGINIAKLTRNQRRMRSRVTTRKEDPARDAEGIGEGELVDHDDCAGLEDVEPIDEHRDHENTDDNDGND